MRFTHIMVLFLAASLSGLLENVEAKMRYPNDLMTDGFGIVTNDDLAFDAHDRLITPFQPAGTNSIHWQCVDVENTTATYSSWHLEPGRFSKNPERLCAPEIQVVDGVELSRFVIQHALPLSECRKFVNEWKALTAKQKKVCLNADFGELQHTKNGDFRLWGLEKYKTRLGCRSYFYGDCKNHSRGRVR